MKSQFLAVAAANTLTLVGPIRVVMALTPQPSEVCYDAYGNTRYVPVGEACKSNETKTKIIPSQATDPAADPQAELQKQVADLTAKVSALEAQINSSQKKQNDSDKSQSGYVAHPNRVTAPFQVVDSAGNVIVDVEAGTTNGTFRGLRAYAMNGSFAQLGNRDPSFYANVSVHAPHDDKPKVAIGIRADNGLPVVSIIGSDGKATAEMTQNSSGGEMHFYNLSGQLTTIIGTNSGNGEGHAVFADANQNPLLIMGAAGDHGDVILGDGKKSIPIWEMALTGFLR